MISFADLQNKNHSFQIPAEIKPIKIHVTRNKIIISELKIKKPWIPDQKNHKTDLQHQKKFTSIKNSLLLLLSLIPFNFLIKNNLDVFLCCKSVLEPCRSACESVSISHNKSYLHETAKKKIFFENRKKTQLHLHKEREADEKNCKTLFLFL